MTKQSIKTQSPSGQTPEVRFHQVLSELIANSPYNNHRRAIWEHAGITSAALSQYVLGRARPRFETLCLLADFFGVTLDFLIMGKETPRGAIESQSMAHYVDWTLADVRERTSAHTWFVTRIGHALANQIDEIAKGVSFAGHQAGEVISDNEMVRLERLSTHCKLITANLHHDLLSVEGVTVAGRFARVAAENIRNGCRYQYLLPRGVTESWDPLIHSYKKLLTEMGITADEMHQCQFLVTDESFFTGCYIYKLDLGRFIREEPIFYEVLRPYISDTNWIGFTRHQHSETLSGPGLIYEKKSLESSIRAFDELWLEGRRS